jgi:phage terminase small subunit
MPRHNAAPGSLTAKEELFVLHFVAGDPGALGNGTRALIAAGYTSKTPAKYASDLLKKPHIKAAVEAERKRISKKLNLTAEKVLSDIERIANKAESAGKFGDAIKGKELLGKHLKLFTEKHEHGGIGGGPVLFQLSAPEESH